MIPPEILLHIFSFASLVDQTFVLPLVSRRIKEMMEKHEHPLRKFIKKPKALSYLKSIHLETIWSVLKQREWFPTLLNDQEVAFDFTRRHSRLDAKVQNLFFRENIHKIFFTGMNIDGDLWMKCNIEVSYRCLKSEHFSEVQNIKIYPRVSPHHFSMFPIFYEEWCPERKGSEWKEISIKKYRHNLWIVDQAVKVAFKIKIDQIAEKNFSLLRTKESTNIRCHCDREGRILDLVSRKKWIPLPNYFDLTVHPVKDSNKKILVWQCGSLNAMIKQAYSIPLCLVYQWAVISKTAKLLAKSNGYLYKL